MNKIILIKNIKQLRYVQSAQPELLRTHKPVTCSPLVYLALHEEGCYVESLTGLLSHKMLDTILKEARILSCGWYKSFEHLLNYREINLGELARIGLIWFFREVLASEHISRCLLGNYKAEEIALFADMDIPCIGHSRYDGSNSILEAMVLYNAELRNIPIRKLFLESDHLLSNLRGSGAAMDIIRPIYHILGSVIGKENILTMLGRYDPKRIPITKFQRDTKRKLAIALGASYDLLILWPVIQCLCNMKEFQGILINNSTTLDIKSDRVGLEADGDIRFIALEDFEVSHNNEYSTAISHLTEAMRHFERETYNLLPEAKVLKNPYLKVQFDYMWGKYFPSAISMIDRLYNLFEKLRPELVIIDDMMSYPQRILVKLARIYGVKSVSIPHGWVGDIDEYEFESDLYLAWGELSKRQLIEEFYNKPEKISVAGALQFEKIAPQLSNPAKPVTDIRHTFGIRTDAPVVMIMTTGFSQSAFSNVIVEKFIIAWEAIIEFALQHPDVEVVIKPHPYNDYIQWYKRFLVRADLPNLKIIEGVKIESLIQAVDIGFMMGVVGTAGYLTLLAQRPLVFLKGLTFYNRFTTEAWNEENGITVANNEKEIGPILERILFDEPFRTECIRRGQLFLEQSVKVGDGGVIDRHVKAIQALFEEDYLHALPRP